MKVSLPTLASPKRFGTMTPKVETAPLASPKWQYNTNALRTLDRHIKGNEVLEFLGENKIYIGDDKKEEDVSVDEKKELIQNLLHIRKRLNEVKEQSEKISNDSTKIKREVDKMKFQEENSNEGMTNGVHKLEQLKVALNYQRAKTEEVTYAQATYFNMLDRLKKDKIADQIKVNAFEEEYTAKYHELCRKLEELKQESELHGKARHFAMEIQRQVEAESQLRQDNLSHLEHNLTAREEYEHKREKRSEHIQHIADNAANEVDDDQKSWNELFQCHKFLKFFLKNKIDKQIKRYETSEKAFQLIKAGTGLTDLNEIVQRFLHREKNYSELLVSIADLERKVTIARKMNDEQRVKLQESREKGMECDKQIEEKHSKKGLVSEAQRQLGVKINEEKLANLVFERAYRWGIRTLTRVDRAQNTVKHDYLEEYPQEKMPNVFLKLIETISANLQVLKEREGDPTLSKLEKFNVDQAMMTRDFAAKNVRVRPVNQRPTGDMTEGKETSKAHIDFEAEDTADEVRFGSVTPFQ